jgi:hypothetical protein
MYNRLILIPGAGTSGSSLLAGMLKALGAHVPEPEAGAGTGPKGFGEPQWVVDFHTRMLRRTNVQITDARPSAWAQTAGVGREPGNQTQLENWVRKEFRRGDHVVVKDPRLVWFIPAWRRAGEVVAAPCFITVLRHPLQVVSSKETGYTDRWHPNALTAGWINTMLYTERATRGDRRALVRHEDLGDDAMRVVARVSEDLELELVERPTPPQMRVATSYVESAGRSSATWSSLEVDHRLVELAEETFKLLDAAAGTEALHDESLRSDLDALRQRYVDLYRFVETTAQFSIGGGARRSGGGPATAPPPLVSRETMQKVVVRAKKKGKKAMHQIKERRSSESDGGKSASQQGS